MKAAQSDVYWIREISGPPRYQLIDETYSFQVRKYIAGEGDPIGHYELVDASTSGGTKKVVLKAKTKMPLMKENTIHSRLSKT